MNLRIKGNIYKNDKALKVKVYFYLHNQMFHNICLHISVSKT